MYKTCMNDRNDNSLTGRGWLPYASTEIPAGSVDRLVLWLVDILKSMALPIDFTGKVLSSARDAAGSIPVTAAKVRVLVFMPATNPPHGQTWGFFRTVRNEETPTETPAETPEQTHVIAFYLYMEGAAKPVAPLPG